MLGAELPEPAQGAGAPECRSQVRLRTARSRDAKPGRPSKSPSRRRAARASPALSRAAAAGRHSPH
eukprot:1135536-Alexandrium_andersonii.AAC.1